MGGIFSGEQLGWDEASIAAFGALPNVLPLPRMDVPGAAPGPAAADGAAASEPSGDSRAAPATGAPSAGGGGGGGGSALSTASAAPARRCQKADVFKAYTMDNFIKATAAAEVFHATWPGQEETTLAIKVVKSEQSRAAMKNIVHDRWNALAALGGGAARRWGSSPDAVKLPSTREATGGSGASPDGLPQPAGHSACEATGEWGVHVLRVLNDAPRHPGVLRLVDVVRPLSDDDEVVAVTEYMAGGSLLEFATRYGTRGDSAMPEAAARAVVAQLAAALGFVHARGFVHRDVSLETAWVSAREPPVRVVLANFGSAVPVADAERVPAWASRGKFGYSPEVGRGEPSSTAVDAWALGVCAYALLAGCMPFKQFDFKLTRQRHFRFAWPSHPPQAVSPEATDFCRRLLAFDAARRMSVEEAVAHPWLRGTPLYGLEADS